MNNMTPLADDEIRELKELCDKATPGPWEHDGLDRYSEDAEWYQDVISTEGNYQALIHVNTGSTNREVAAANVGAKQDAEFVAVSRLAMPRLIAELESLRTVVGKLPKTADGILIVPGMKLFSHLGTEKIYEESAGPIATRYEFENYFSTREAAIDAKDAPCKP